MHPHHTPSLLKGMLIKPLVLQLPVERPHAEEEAVDGQAGKDEGGAQQPQRELLSFGTIAQTCTHAR
jgi:hypothetical protein